MQKTKPAFNVVVPFEAITMIQMNRQMTDLVSEFIFDFDEIDDEVYAFADHLINPGSWSRKSSDIEEQDWPSFTIDRINNVYCVLLNKKMCQSLICFFDEVEEEDVEIQVLALSKALKDPEKCSQIRFWKNSKKPAMSKSQL